MNPSKGRVVVPKRLSYVAQQAWIQNMSVRDNITFGKPLDADRYSAVLKATALDADVAILPVHFYPSHPYASGASGGSM
jgi:ABC-type multidrug transport system fused ATPase/permease subunit